MIIARKVVIHFPKRLADQPVIYRLVKDYDLEFNILKASITPEEEGLLVLELKGRQSEYEKGIKFLAKAGVQVQPLSEDVTRNETRCTHCGACITICPAGAFELDPATRKTTFNNEKCFACGLCIKACPPRAMEARL
jgi:ferredoxin